MSSPDAALAAIDAARAYRLPPRQEPAFPPLDLDEAQDEIDAHRNAPRPDPACLYGLVGEIARAGSATTEANPYAVAAAAIAYLGVAVGRGPYIDIGNTWHHARQFLLHVGRSGEGRKGDAVSLVQRIARRIAELSPDHAPKIHAGGLSTREGLVFLIHDGYRDGKEDVPPILDKRLLVIESEFVNILHQGKRDGNTLSAALRDLFDGKSIYPATKSNRLGTTDPHVGMLAAITRAELLECVAARDLTNGFFNRFMPFWAERPRLVPIPQATPAAEVDRLALRVIEVLKFCSAERWADRDAMHVPLSKDAEARYTALYKGELNSRSHGERINALVERRAPMLRRLAMLFALTDCAARVEVVHIDAALAWIRYSVESVKFIFGSAEDEVKTAEVNDTAARILEFLKRTPRASRTQITKDCFGGHTPKTRIDAALDELLTNNPPSVLVEEDRSAPGRPVKRYSLIEAGDSSQVRIVREIRNHPETRMNAGSSHISHISHPSHISPVSGDAGDELEAL